jgi:hypothetical protein
MIRKIYAIIFLISSFSCFSQSFQPSSISNLSLWLRADAGISQTAGSVSQWNDQSGAGNNCSQSTSANRPFQVLSVPELNGNSAIRFDGTNDLLNGTTIPNLNNSSFTIFIVANGESQASSIASLFSVNTASNGFYFTRRPSTNKFGMFNNGTNVNSVGNFPGSGYIYRMLTGVKTLNTSFVFRSNPIQDFNSVTSGATVAFTNTNYQIGAGNSANFFKGDIAEIIIYTQALSSTEISQVERYLMDKYAPPVNLGADINNSYGFCDITLAPTSGFYTSYLWSNSATTSSISINNPGTYSVAATHIFGRISRDTIVVNRPHYALLNLNNQLVCYNDLPTVTAPMPAGDYTFSQWSDGNLNQTRQYTQGGTLSYTVRDNQNCTATSNTATISFDNSLQNVRLGNDTTLCVGNTIGLQVSSSSITSYLWSTGSTTVTTTVIDSDEYDILVTNANGCQKRDTVLVAIAGESPSVQVTMPNSACVGNSFNYSHSSSVNGGNIQDVLWSFGDNTTAIENSGTKIYNQVGTYNGSILVTTDEGCQTQVPFQVAVKNLPLVNFNVPTFCTGQPVNITNSSSVQSGGGALQHFNWLVDDQFSANTQNLNFTFPTNGNYLVKLIATDVNGCVDSTQQTVLEGNDFPIPMSTTLMTPVPNVTLAVGQTQTFQWSSVANTVNYIFEVSTSSTFSTIRFSNSNEG